MKVKVNPKNSGAEVLSIRRTGREEILLVLKEGGDVSAFEKALDQAVGKKANVKSLVGKRLLPGCASRWASQNSGTSAGCTSASAVCRLRWSV